MLGLLFTACMPPAGWNVSCELGPLFSWKHNGLSPVRVGSAGGFRRLVPVTEAAGATGSSRSRR